MRRTLPLPLRKGDVIAVVAPAGPVDPDLLARGLSRLSAAGYVPETAAEIGSRDRFLAGDDAHRADRLSWAMALPEGRAVMAARGGYGCARLLPLLDWRRFRRRPKILVGYSDVTAILSYASTRLGVPSIHGPMAAADLARRHGAGALEAFARLAAGDVGRREPWGPPCERVRGGPMDGILAGGCLSVVTGLLGTPFEPDFRGAILFLEDVKEPSYRLDRHLTQWVQSGRLSKIAGILVGRTAPVPGETEEDVVRPFAEAGRRLGVPVRYGFPAGHGEENLSLPFGTRARIDTKGRLFLLEPPVEAR